MKRRHFMQGALALGTLSVVPKGAAEAVTQPTKKPILTIAHITDVHIHGNDNVPERAKKCLAETLKNKVDFILNGGDSIMDASYDNVTREMVTAQWAVWDGFIKNTTLDVYSCIGNHDPWWKAPAKTDEMYGIPYVVKRLKIPNRYYSFSRKGWHFIILDGNNKGTTLDPEQMEWLKKELDQLAPNTPVLLMSHFPMLSITNSWAGGQHGDYKELKALFYKHKNKVKVCLSGHQHLLDKVWYNNVNYFCNGAMCGFWWGKGDKQSAAAYYYEETPPGYALLRLYADGSVENEYIPYNFEA
jgi:Icc protein